MQTLHPVTVLLPRPPVSLLWPVTNQFPSLLLCPGFPAAAGAWNTVGSLFSELDHCLWVVWVWCLFFPVWLQAMCSANHFTHVYLLHLVCALVCVSRREYDCDMCCELLTVCKCDSLPQHPSNSPCKPSHPFTHLPSILLPPSFFPLSLFVLVSLLWISFYLILFQLICYRFFFPLSSFISYSFTLSTTPSTLNCSRALGVGEEEGEHGGKQRKRVERKARHIVVASLIESQQFGQRSLDVWEWPGMCNSWLCLCMWKRERALLWLWRLTDCACSSDYLRLCVFVFVNDFASAQMLSFLLCVFRSAVVVLHCFPLTSLFSISTFHSVCLFNQLSYQLLLHFVCLRQQQLKKSEKKKNGHSLIVVTDSFDWRMQTSSWKSSPPNDLWPSRRRGAGWHCYVYNETALCEAITLHSLFGNK